MGEPNDQVSDCSYCGMRFKVLDLPHKYGCPGLEIERLTTENGELDACATDYRHEIDRLKIEHGDMNLANVEYEKQIERLTADLSTARQSLYEVAEQRNALTAENARLKNALAESCDENRAHVLAEGPWSTDMCPIAGKLSAEGTTMRIALQAIAKHYKPNWKPGDTHVSTQRLSGIAHDALAVCASGSQPPLEDLLIDDEDRKWADSRVDGSQTPCGHRDSYESNGHIFCRKCTSQIPVDGRESS